MSSAVHTEKEPGHGAVAAVELVPELFDRLLLEDDAAAPAALERGGGGCEHLGSALGVDAQQIVLGGLVALADRQDDGEVEVARALKLVRANEPLDHADHPQRVTSSALQSVQRYVTGFTARQSGFRRGHALTTMLTAAEFPTEVVKSRVAK